VTGRDYLLGPGTPWRAVPLDLPPMGPVHPQLDALAMQLLGLEDLAAVADRYIRLAAARGDVRLPPRHNRV
jgi:hypothetical protein